SSDLGDDFAHPSIAGVMVVPGAILLIRMPCFPYSNATDFVKPTTACLDAVYGVIFGEPSKPAPEAEFTIAPPPFFTISLISCLDRKSTRLNSSHVSTSYAVC